MQGFETRTVSGSGVPARLTKMRSWMQRWRETHGWVEPVYVFDPSIRTLPSATWRLLTALDDVHNAAHNARRDWWLMRAARPRRQVFTSFGALFVSIIVGMTLQMWLASLLVASVTVVLVARVALLRLVADIDGIEVHRMDRYQHPAEQLRCMGGPGQLPGWVGQMLMFPATTHISTPALPLGEIIGVDSWFASLGLDSSELETLQVLLDDWDGATLADAVDVARVLSRS
jgi:hypothetical protein